MQPRILQLRRLVIAEADRFPELGRTFYEQGPGRTIAALATVFERLAARARCDSTTRCSRPRTSTGSSCRRPLNRAMLLGDDQAPATAALNRYADAGVRAFMAAYAQP